MESIENYGSGSGSGYGSGYGMAMALAMALAMAMADFKPTEARPNAKACRPMGCAGIVPRPVGYIPAAAGTAVVIH